MCVPAQPATSATKIKGMILRGNMIHLLATEGARSPGIASTRVRSFAAASLRGARARRQPDVSGKSGGADSRGMSSGLSPVPSLRGRRFGANKNPIHARGFARRGHLSRGPSPLLGDDPIKVIDRSGDGRSRILAMPKADATLNHTQNSAQASNDRGSSSSQ